MNLRTANNRRKNKEYIKALFKYYEGFKLGDIYHACSLHPCITTHLDILNNDIEGKSILDGSEGHCCSLTSCGVYIMEQEEIDRYVEAWNRDGERGILAVYYGSEEAADEFLKNWR